MLWASASYIALNNNIVSHIIEKADTLFTDDSSTYWYKCAGQADSGQEVGRHTHNTVRCSYKDTYTAFTGEHGTARPSPARHLFCTRLHWTHKQRELAIGGTSHHVMLQNGRHLCSLRFSTVVVLEFFYDTYFGTGGSSSAEVGIVGIDRTSKRMATLLLSLSILLNIWA